MSGVIVSTSTIQPRQIGLDFVTAPVAEVKLFADGYRFAVLYICRPQETHMAKVATPERVARLHAAGIAVLLNYEASGKEGAQGAARGLADGRWSRDFAERMGYPYGLPLMCSSFDTDVRPYLSTATAYGEAFADGLGDSYRLGVYGGTPIISALRDRDPIGWKAMARSWSPLFYFPTIHIDQFGRAYNNGADVDTCKTAFDAWLPHTVPDPPKPIPPVPVPPVPVPPPPSQEDFDTMIYSPAAAYDSRKPGGGGPLYVRVPDRPGSRTIIVAPGQTGAQVIITPIGFVGRGHLRWSGNGVEPDFSAAQFWTGYPPMALGMWVHLNGDGALDVWVEGEDGAACDVIISRTDVNG